MKKVILAAVAMFVTVGVMAQGNVLFQSKVATASIDAKITKKSDGQTLPANSLVAELGYATSAGGAVTWTGITAPVTATGYFAGGTKSLANIAAGVDTWFQVRAFDAGKTWETKTLWQGESAVFGPIKLTSPPATPANLVGLTAFSVVPVPEPSVLALGVLGLGAFMLRRRS